MSLPIDGPLVLDTSAAIDLLKNKPTGPVVHGNWRVPVQVIGELRFGAVNSTRVTTNLAKVDGLLELCQALDSTPATAAVYADVRWKLHTKGRLIPENDLWIAASCLEHRLPLASSDRHFDEVEGLQRRSLPQPAPNQ